MNGPKIKDEGLRILQTKVVGGGTPQRLNTRKADVQRPLMAVCDMVDCDHAVLFDSGGSYAMHKKTGKITPFVRKGKGWDLTLEIDAPEHANEVMKQVISELKEIRQDAWQPEIRLQANTGDERLELTQHDDTLFRLAVPMPERPKST